MKYKLQDLIDLEQFQNLQDRLNEIYSFPSAIIDNEGNILTNTAWQEICLQFHRKNKDCELGCIQSDQYILSHLHEANPAVTYRCPHGLVDNATPIIIDGIHYGNFFTGQFFLEKPDLAYFRTQAEKYGFDEDAYLVAVKKVPIWSQEQLNSYLFFIKGLIAIISESGLKRLKEIETRKQIEDSEERAEAILGQMQDGFWITNTQDGQIVDANDAMCRMLGYARNEMLKMCVADIEANDSPEIIAQRIQHVIQVGSAHFESRFRRRDGTNIDVEVSVTYLPKRKLFFGFHHDITERVRVEKERGTLLEIMQGLTHTKDLHEFLSLIHRSIERVMYAENFFVVFYNQESHLFEEVYSVDQYDPPAPPSKLEKSITAYVFRSGEPLLLKNEEFDKLVALGALELVGSSSACWLGVPLNTPDGPIGVMVVQDYENPDRFSKRDRDFLASISSQVALAIERKRAEETLQQSHDMIFKLTAQVPGVVYQYRLYPDGRSSFPFASPGMNDIYEVTPEEVQEDATPVFGRLHPDDYDRIVASIQESARTLQPFHCEFRVVLPLQGLRWRLSDALPERMEDGGTLWYGIISDITERKLAEEALRENKEYLSNLLENSPVSIYVTDANTQLRLVNRRWEDDAGKPRTDVLGRPLDQVFPAEVARKFTADNQKVFETGASFAFEEAVESHHFFTVKFPLHDASGHVEAVGGISMDITERKQAEEKERAAQAALQRLLAESNQSRQALLSVVEDQKRTEEEKAKLQEHLIQAQKMESVGRLAGGVAHDFNNLLGVIMGHAETALVKIPPHQTGYHDLQEIFKAAQRSADLTRQLLAFARKQTIRPMVLNLNDTIASMLKMLKRLIGEDIELIWRPGSELKPVKVDPSQVDQILANLLVNARDAISAEGKIMIETENATLTEADCAQYEGLAAGEYVSLTVSDNGSGMDQETLSHLFEPFFTTKEVGKGTGLGLATVFGIVKQNNGYIYAASQPGKGTTFKIYLLGYETEILPTSAVKGSETRPGGSEIILMVEDEEMLLELGVDTLEELGYTILAANTPADALRIAQGYNGPIDLLITDVVMPGMNGKKLAEQIHLLQPGLKCLFMSGYTTDIIGDHGVIGEEVFFIQKPFLLTDLAVKVRQVLEQERPAG